MKYHRIYGKKYRNFYYILGKVTEFLLLRIILGADLFLPQSNWMLKYFLNKGISSKKMVAHPSGVNHLKFNLNRSGKEIRRTFGLLNSQVLLHLGRIDRIRNLFFLIKVYLAVRKQFPNVKLLMIGNGNEKEFLERMVYERNLQKDIIFTGNVPHSEVPSYIAAADVCVSPLPPNLIFKMSTPTKVYEYLSMGKPVVVSDIPEQKAIIYQSNAGICVPYLEDEFTKAICYLLNNKKTAKKMGKRGREFIIRYHTYDFLTKKLIAAYKMFLKC
jgi:glycosyltransferase involved in cell wall biosynthesis